MTVGEAFEHAPRSCPACGRVLDAATQVDGPGAVPVAGDVTVCFYCGAGLVYTADAFEEMSANDVAELEAVSDTFRGARRAVAAFLARNDPPV